MSFLLGLWSSLTDNDENLASQRSFVYPGHE